MDTRHAKLKNRLEELEDALNTALAENDGQWSGRADNIQMDIADVEHDIRELEKPVDPNLWEPPTIEVCAKAIKIPVRKWPGKCYGISLAICHVKRLKIPGRPVYGAWDGPVHRDSLFAGKILVNHGWIALEDGRILDPTRWVFECNDPYLFCGVDTDSYDLGSNRRKERFLQPPPKKVKDQKQYSLNFKSFDTARFVLEIFQGAVKPADLKGWRVKLTHPQVLWLASYPLHLLGAHAGAIYLAAIDAGHPAAIPLDNREAVLGLGKT